MGLLVGALSEPSEPSDLWGTLHIGGWGGATGPEHNLWGSGWSYTIRYDVVDWGSPELRGRSGRLLEVAAIAVAAGISSEVVGNAGMFDLFDMGNHLLEGD